MAQVISDRTPGDTPLRFRTGVDLQREYAVLESKGVFGKGNVGSGGKHAASWGANDFMLGGRADPIKAAADEPNRQLASYFGPPNRINPFTSGYTPDKSIITFRESYDENNLFLSSTVDKLNRQLESWPTRFICPWLHVNDIDLAWTFMDVENTMLEGNPELAPPRYITIKTTKRTATLGRKSLGFIMEHGFQKKDQGKFHYLLMIAGIAQATLNVISVMVLREFFRFDSAYEIYLRTEMKAFPSPEDSLRVSRNQFAAAQKEQYFMERMIGESVNIMRREGVEPTDFIIPADLKNYVMTNSDEKLSGTDPKYSKALMGGDTFIYMGKRIHAIMSIYIDGSTEEVNPAKRCRQVGDYAKISDHHRPTDSGFTTADRSIYIMNMDNGSGVMTKIDMAQAIANSGRFAEDGSLHDYHQNLASNNPFKNNPDFPHKYADMFLVENENADAAGREPLRVVDMWGEISPWAFPEDTIKTTAKSAIPILLAVTGYTKEDAETWLRKGLSLIKDLSNPDLNSMGTVAWLTAAMEGARMNISPDTTKKVSLEILPAGRDLVPELPYIVELPGGSKTIQIGSAGTDGKKIYKFDIYEMAMESSGQPRPGNLPKAILALADLIIHNQGQYENGMYENHAEVGKALMQIRPVVVATDNAEEISRKICIAMGDEKMAGLKQLYQEVVSSTNHNSIAENLSWWKGVSVFSLEGADHIKPYGYGSWCGMKALSRLSGGDKRGISESIIETAKHYTTIVQGMYENALASIVHKEHVSVDPDRCPWWFSTRIGTGSEETQRAEDSLTTFAQSFVDSSHNFAAYAFLPVLESRSWNPETGLTDYVGLIVAGSLSIKPDSDKTLVLVWDETSKTIKWKQLPLAAAAEPGVIGLTTGVPNDVRISWQYLMSLLRPYAPGFFEFIGKSSSGDMTNINGEELNMILLKSDHWINKFNQFVKNSHYKRSSTYTTFQRRGDGLGDLINDLIYSQARDFDPIGLKKVGNALDFITDLIAKKQMTVLTDTMLDTALTNPTRAAAPEVGSVYQNQQTRNYLVVNSRLVISPESFKKYYDMYTKATLSQQRAKLRGILVLSPSNPSNSLPVFSGSADNLRLEDVILEFSKTRAKMRRHDLSGIASSSAITYHHYISTGVKADGKRKRSNHRVSGYDEMDLLEQEEHEHTTSSRMQRIYDDETNTIKTARRTGRSFQTDPTMWEGESAPLTVQYGHKGMKGITLNTNLVNNYGKAYKESRDVFRLAMELILFCQVDKHCMDKWLENNILVPVDILLMRPHCRYMTLSGIACRGGSELGHVVYTGESFEVGDEAKTKTHIGHFSLYLGVIMKSVKNFMIWWDMKVVQYLSGEGVGFWTPDTWRSDIVISPKLGTGYRPSIFAIMCPYGSLNREPAMYTDSKNNAMTVYVPGMVKLYHNITGYHRQDVIKYSGMVPQVVPHYPSAAYADMCYNWSSLNTTGSSRARTSFNYQFNEVVYQTYQRVCDSTTGEHSKYIASHGVFPNYMYGDGKKSLRLGEVTATSFVVANKADIDNKDLKMAL